MNSSSGSENRTPFVEKSDSFHFPLPLLHPTVSTGRRGSFGSFQHNERFFGWRKSYWKRRCRRIFFQLATSALAAVDYFKTIYRFFQSYGRGASAKKTEKKTLIQRRNKTEHTFRWPNLHSHDLPFKLITLIFCSTTIKNKMFHS